jgi:hypothetical protein
MTDSPAGGVPPRTKKDEVIEDAVVIDEATDTPVVVETVHATKTEPVIPTDDPGSVQTAEVVDEVPAEPGHRVVYVQLPEAPKKQGNRGFGALVAVLATILFTVLLAIVTAVVGVVRSGALSVNFLTDAQFYIPSLFFLIAFLLLVLLANRANWWAYIVGSLVVGLVVYFGSIGLGLLSGGIVSDTPDVAAGRFASALGNPFVIIAGLLAREVAMWTGTAVSRRGRRLKVRNVEAREAYDREIAEKRAEYDRSSASAATAV